MITRPQAEALLLLAEAMESCEHQGVAVSITVGYNGMNSMNAGQLSSAVQLRCAISEMYTKKQGR